MRLLNELRTLLLTAKPFVKPEFTQPMCVIALPEEVRQDLLHAIMVANATPADELRRGALMLEMHQLEAERFNEADSRVKKRAASRRTAASRRKGTD